MISSGFAPLRNFAEAAMPSPSRATFAIDPTPKSIPSTLTTAELGSYIVSYMASEALPNSPITAMARASDASPAARATSSPTTGMNCGFD